MSAIEQVSAPILQQEQSPGMGEYIAGLQRRKKPMLIAGGIMMFLALMAALLWPPTYSTSATILIEEQEIPQDMVRTTITGFATQQIEIIRQRVLTLKNIMQIVEKFGLYDEDELARKPRTEISEEFIEAVQLELLDTEVIDPRSGRPMAATIAFTLQFQSDSARSALSVTNELVNLFLNENLRTRTAKASSTSDFLRQEAENLSEEVKSLEEQIARFKADNQTALPENFPINMQNLTRYQTQLLQAEARLQELGKRLPEIEAQLASTSAYAPTVLPSGESVLADVDRLKALQSEYRRKAARYSDSHPDVVRIKREIDALAAEVGHAGNKNDLTKLLANRKVELNSLKTQYAADHPEVKAQEQLVALLEEQLTQMDDGEPDVPPDNPAYVILDNQFKALQMEESGLKTQIEQMNAQIVALNEAALKAPGVEREYNNLRRNREVAIAKYLDLRVKLKEAELAGELEQDRKGQRFTLIDPPALPEKPVSPNRLAILILGVILAGGVGLGLGLLLESTDQSIRSNRGLGTLMGIAPLVTIPYIETPAEKIANQPKRKLIILIATGIALSIIFLLLVHFFYKPLDVLWFVILRKLGIG